MRDGTEVDDPRFGRLELFDPDSRGWQIRSVLDDPGANLRSAAGRYFIPGPTLDQDQEGQCVSEAIHDARNGSPDRTKPTVTAFEERQRVYHALQHLDPWGGCYQGPRCQIEPSPAAYDGTAVLTGGMYGIERGWWDEVRWIGAGSGRLEDDLIDTHRTIGGIIYGIPWLEGMYETTPSGLVEVTGTKVGGHAIHGWEWAPRQRMRHHWVGTKPGVWCHNSWGPGYGIKRRGVSGCGFVPLDDLLGLLERDGEGMVPLCRN